MASKSKINLTEPTELSAILNPLLARSSSSKKSNNSKKKSKKTSKKK